MIMYTMRLKFWSLDWNSLVTPKKTSVASFCAQPSARAAARRPRVRALEKLSPWFTR